MNQEQQKLEEVSELLCQFFVLVDDIIENSDGVKINYDTKGCLEDDRKPDGTIPWQSFKKTCWLGIHKDVKNFVEEYRESQEVKR